MIDVHPNANVASVSLAYADRWGIAWRAAGTPPLDIYYTPAAPNATQVLLSANSSMPTSGTLAPPQIVASGVTKNQFGVAYGTKPGIPALRTINSDGTGVAKEILGVQNAADTAAPELDGLVAINADWFTAASPSLIHKPTGIGVETSLNHFSSTTPGSVVSSMNSFAAAAGFSPGAGSTGQLFNAFVDQTGHLNVLWYDSNLNPTGTNRFLPPSDGPTNDDTTELAAVGVDKDAVLLWRTDSITANKYTNLVLARVSAGTATPTVYTIVTGGLAKDFIALVFDKANLLVAWASENASYFEVKFQRFRPDPPFDPIDPVPLSANGNQQSNGPETFGVAASGVNSYAFAFARGTTQYDLYFQPVTCTGP